MKITASKKYFKRILIYRILFLLFVYASSNIIFFLASRDIFREILYFSAASIIFLIFIFTLIKKISSLKECELFFYISSEHILVPKNSSYLRKDKKILIEDITHIQGGEGKMAGGLIITSSKLAPTHIQADMFSNLDDYKNFTSLLFEYSDLKKNKEFLIADKISKSPRRQLPISVILFLILFIVFFIFSPENNDEQVFKIIQYGAMQSTLFFTGDYYRLTTGIFLHAHFIHLAMNLIVLLSVSLLLEPIIGSGKQTMLLLASGIFSSLFAMLSYDYIAIIGASGALYGLLGFALIINIKYYNELPTISRFFHKKIVSIIILSILIIEPIIFHLFHVNVAYTAHVSGFIFGVFLGYMYCRKKKSVEHFFNFTFIEKGILSFLVLLCSINFLWMYFDNNRLTYQENKDIFINAVLNDEYVKDEAKNFFKELINKNRSETPLKKKIE